MFNLIFVFFFGVLSIIGVFIPNEIINIVSYVLGGISFGWLFVSIISSMCYYSEQLSRFETIRSFIKIKTLKILERDELITDFKYFLGEKYPDFEKEIFQNLIDSKEIILQFPELKTSKTLIKLVNNLKEYSSGIFNYERRIEEEIRDVRFYNNSKWEIFTPEIPTDIKKLF